MIHRHVGRLAGFQRRWRTMQVSRFAALSAGLHGLHVRLIDATLLRKRTTYALDARRKYRRHSCRKDTTAPLKRFSHKRAEVDAAAKCKCRKAICPSYRVRGPLTRLPSGAPANGPRLLDAVFPKRATTPCDDRGRGAGVGDGVSWW